MQTTTSVLIVAALGILVCTTVLAQSQLYVYPQQGQSEEQQSKDRFECHNWAVQQSGFDPGNPPPIPGRFIPDVIFPISSALTASAFSRASFVAVRIKSCRKSFSSGSIASGFISTD